MCFENEVLFCNEPLITKLGLEGLLMWKTLVPVEPSTISRWQTSELNVSLVLQLTHRARDCLRGYLTWNSADWLSVYPVIQLLREMGMCLMTHLAPLTLFRSKTRGSNNVHRYLCKLFTGWCFYYSRRATTEYNHYT